ncbi:MULTISPECIES: hypothetical protein [Asticcacaulis]|uniref:hypothetical protein n=1 Tax=Asticcacaulis TaxID=76890 RepID=UPI001AE7B5B0|nr:MULTISPECIES: hypothetical protein [Asticcacaulis]MBP2159122.1 hypothetical protein [Asticcacaulis solisilvae]MDR6800167.1 hypothetical protein [Asticcacaulis sp. BE141]
MPVLDFQNMQQIQRLTDILGEEECKRLGFLFEDERGVVTLSTAGLEYLIDIEARGIRTIAEAYAAGYQCAAEFHSTANENHA